MDRIKFHLKLIKDAQILLKYVLGIKATYPKLNYFDKFWYFNHVFTKKDLLLTDKEESHAFYIIEDVTAYLLTVQMDTALEATFNNRFSHRNKKIQSCAWIVRLIRNAFAHNPFCPIWKTYPECENKLYEIPNIIKLNTAGLHGKPVKKEHYGGLLSLLCLSQFLVKEMKKKEKELINGVMS